jgi:hypothetical protein
MADGDPKAFKTTPIDPVKGDVPKGIEVSRFHTNADTDGGRGAAHHTLGPNSGQAAPGDHDHRGGNSVLLLQGVTITGARGGNVALASVIAVLVELGATDSTTA